MTTAVLVCSLLLQIAATVIALRLIKQTGRFTAWALIASAITLMAVRRSITLYRVLHEDARPDFSAELVALVISVLMLLGIAWIGRLVAVLGAAEREVRQLVESAPAAMIIADAQDKITLVNAQTVRLFGWSRSEMLGRDVEMLVPERFRARHHERRALYHESPRPRVLGVDEELFALRKDGTEFPVEISVSPLETVAGPCVASAVRDVTAQREAAAALRESEGRYRSLLDDVLDSSSVGVCILDGEKRVVWVNRAFESFFGLQRNEVIGFDARRIVRERLHHVFEDPFEFRDRVLRTYEDNTYHEHFECRVVKDEGREERWLYHWSQPIESGLYAGGRIEHYTDVSERRLAEERTRLFVDIVRNMRSGLLVYHQEDPADDRSLRVVSVNPAGERLLGVERSDLLGKLVDEAFPGLRERGLPGLFADVIRTGDSREVQDFRYGDDRVLENAWAFSAFPLPGQRVGVVFDSISEREQTEELIRNLAAGVAGSTGESFFRSLVLHLARSLEMEYAFVGELVDPAQGRVESVAFCVDGEVVDQVGYELSGTPCEGVVGQRLCCFESGVRERFPEDAMLQEMNVESYLGTPLFDSSGDPLGLIAVLGRKPLGNADRAAAVLRIFAARAAAEMERQRATQR